MGIVNDSNRGLLSKNMGMIKIIITLIISVFLFHWVKYRGSQRGKIILANAVVLDFHGKVDSIYRDKSDHNAMRVVLEGGYNYGVYADWETKIELGDSLSKKKGALFVEIYKNRGQKVILDYRSLVKGFRN